MPPGLVRRGLPAGLLSQLPPRNGYSYAYVGASIVLIEIATGLVASVLSDALSR